MHAHFATAVETLDVALLRRMWAHVAPNMPQPRDDVQALATAHYARTLMGRVKFDLRAYSHAWLLERALPSGLPDNLRPRAQRVYPVTVGSVGIAVRGSTEIGRVVAPLILGAMEYAVKESYADGHKDEPKVVKGRMMEARKVTIRKLLG